MVSVGVGLPLGGEPQALGAIAAQDREVAGIPEPRGSCASQAGQHLGPLVQVLGSAQCRGQMLQRGAPLAGQCGVNQRHHVDAGLDELTGDQQQQRPGPGQRDATGRHEATGFQGDLRGTRVHDAR
ncbi:hypothetical protein WJ977_21100 [Achromobacter xylosoxidans]